MYRKQLATECSVRIRVVFFWDGGRVFAQALEVDICASGASLDEAQSNFMLAASLDRDLGMARNGKPFGGIEPAPKHFFEMWESLADAPVRR
jgi:hypothetical protein